MRKYKSLVPGCTYDLVDVQDGTEVPDRHVQEGMMHLAWMHNQQAKLKVSGILIRFRPAAPAAASAAVTVSATLVVIIDVTYHQ